MFSSTPRISPRLLAGVCAGAIGALGFAAPAMAQSSTIAINDCKVAKSRDTGVVWFSCGVRAQGSKKISATYTSNLATRKPKTAGTWRNRTGTVSLKGGSVNLKFAVKNKDLTVKQVKHRVKVTLSDAKGGTITDAVARAAK